MDIGYKKLNSEDVTCNCSFLTVASNPCSCLTGVTCECSSFSESEQSIIKFIEKLCGSEDMPRILEITNTAIYLHDKEFEALRIPLGLFYHVKVTALVYSAINIPNTEELKCIPYYIKKELRKFMVTFLTYESVDFYFNIVNNIDTDTELDTYSTDIKNIVSDACNISVLGISGHERLKEYYKTKYKLEKEEKELFRYVDKEISRSIPYIIKTFKTRSGRKIGIEKRSEFYITHEDWRKVVFPR
jgi:hypothetical protein